MNTTQTTLPTPVRSEVPQSSASASTRRSPRPRSAVSSGVHRCGRVSPVSWTSTRTEPSSTVTYTRNSRPRGVPCTRVLVASSETHRRMSSARSSVRWVWVLVAGIAGVVGKAGVGGGLVGEPPCCPGKQRPTPARGACLRPATAPAGVLRGVEWEVRVCRGAKLGPWGPIRPGSKGVTAGNGPVSPLRRSRRVIAGQRHVVRQALGLASPGAQVLGTGGHRVLCMIAAVAGAGHTGEPAAGRGGARCSKTPVRTAPTRHCPPQLGPPDPDKPSRPPRPDPGFPGAPPPAHPGPGSSGSAPRTRSHPHDVPGRCRADPGLHRPHPVCVGRRGRPTGDLEHCPDDLADAQAVGGAPVVGEGDYANPAAFSGARPARSRPRLVNISRHHASAVSTVSHCVSSGDR